MKHYTVYQYTFPDGKIYIGMTGNKIENRRDCGYGHNKRLQAAMKAAGWSKICVSVLATCDTRDEAFRAEREAIAYHNATDPSVGYNISQGGKSTFEGLKHSAQTRKRMSDINIGKTFSSKTIQRMRDPHAKERVPVESYTNGEETAIQ